jgi:hypothetical protein
MTFVAQGLAPFLKTGRARGEQEIAGNSSFVVCNNQPVPTHWFEYLQFHRPNTKIRWLMGRSARAVKSVLPAIDGETQAAIKDAQVRVATHADPKIEAAVFCVSVIPVPIVMKTIAGGGVENGLDRLVNRVVV